VVELVSQSSLILLSIKNVKRVCAEFAKRNCHVMMCMFLLKKTYILYFSKSVVLPLIQLISKRVTILYRCSYIKLGEVKGRNKADLMVI